MNDNLISDCFYRRIDPCYVVKLLKEGKRVQYFFKMPSGAVKPYWKDIPSDQFNGAEKSKVDFFLNNCGPFRVVEIMSGELLDDLECDEFENNIYISMNPVGAASISVFSDSNFDTSCYYIQPTKEGIDNARRIARTLEAWAANIENCYLTEE